MGASANADRAGGPSDLSPSSGSQPEAPIPCASNEEASGLPISALLRACAHNLRSGYLANDSVLDEAADIIDALRNTSYSREPDATEELLGALGYLLSVARVSSCDAEDIAFAEAVYSKYGGVDG